MSILTKQLTKATIKQHITLDVNVSCFMLDGSSSSEFCLDVHISNLLLVISTRSTQILISFLVSYIYLEAASGAVQMMYYRFRPNKVGSCSSPCFLSHPPVFFWCSCPFWLLLGREVRWVHGKWHWARFAYYYYVLMCSINNRKVPRRFCAPIHDGSMMRMTSLLCERYEFIMWR